MKFWLTCFMLLFGGAELLQWFRQFSLPLPVFILGGAFLAVASNYDKLTDHPWHIDHGAIAPEEDTPAALDATGSKGNSSPMPRPISFTIRQPQAIGKSISFTIRKPEQEG